jgi:nucleoredoxin
VALYFSAHWCPPCRNFTPILRDFYDEVTEDGEFEIVFVSFDRSDSDLQNYLKEAHGNWLYVPFGNDQIQELANKFGVSGIPALIVIKPDGAVINQNGRADVQVNSKISIFFKLSFFRESHQRRRSLIGRHNFKKCHFVMQT